MMFRNKRSILFILLATLISVCLLLGTISVPALAGGNVKTFSHPLGIQFDYPGNWELKEDQTGLYLIPNAASKNAQGIPQEFIVFQSAPAEGVQNPTDPEVVAWFDQLWAQGFPGMKRTGPAKPVSTGLGPGAAMMYEGNGSRHKVYVTLFQGQGIIMGHLLQNQKTSKLDSVARTIFTSLNKGKVQVDPNLIRTWSRSVTEGSPGLNASVYGSYTITWVFKADGTVLYSSKSRIDGNTTGLGVNIHSESDPSVYQGRFVTSNKRLYITWSSGLEENYKYSVFLDHEGTPSLSLTAPGEKAKYYQ